MPGNPKPLAFTTFPTYRQKLQYDVQSSTRCVLSFDPAKLELVPHYWPVSEGARVPPAELRQYREAHQYLGPGCLCPLLEPLSEEPVFREAAIYLTWFGRYEGEYVAECAKASAHVPHRPVPIERIFPLYGVPVKVYPLRGVSTPCPPQVLHERETRPVTKRPLKRTYAQADLMDPPSAAPESERVDLSVRTDWRRFVKLDSMDRPGLTEEEFLGLFVKCDACALITTHLMFHKHHCGPQTGDDLDLTDQE
ncbi:hypothetical protein JOM56_013716 [Amanita muscaria]